MLYYQIDGLFTIMELSQSIYTPNKCALKLNLNLPLFKISSSINLVKKNLKKAILKLTMPDENNAVKHQPENP